VIAIESGNIKVALNIIHNKYYPHPISDVLSYIGIKGDARIITYEDNDQIAAIQLKLLEKYDPNNEYDWINKLVDKLESEPKNAWLIEITPTKWFSY
ncbi:MAG: hypothetical protein GPJ54_10170, partial [Candidatus Heimdallarchaeota archaeon]|nr:hypothetical protein [Candidatus Heimdallarchaeota archaeon]